MAEINQECAQQRCCTEQQAAQEMNDTANNALVQCKVQLEEWREKYLRVQADLDNFTRRIDKEKGAWMRTAQASVLKGLLDIVDDFERALHNPPTDVAAQQWVTGFDLIAKSLKKYLASQGVEEITQMQTFDPMLHEALMQVASPDHATGAIVTILQKGYLFKGEVLRPAKVSVAS